MEDSAPLARRWLGELPIHAAALVLFAICAGVLAAKGVLPEAAPVLANARLYLLTACGLVAVDAGMHLARHRPATPFASLREHYCAPTLLRGIAAGAPLLLLCVFLMPFFSKMKAAIPLFNDYSWDATFIAWDRALFFGYDAWEVLQPVLGYPVVTAALALLYQLWFLLLYPGVLFFAFARIDADVRRRFFLTYVLSWTLVGGAMATWLASAGPCFVGPLLDDPSFDAQMAYLNAANEQVPVMTLTVQQMLLDWFHADADGLGSGITAMPSMHVAIAFLYWIATREISPRLGRWFCAFFAVIWIGSVPLAYHYAVDGLVSVIAVAAIWWTSRHAIAAWDRWIEARAQPSLRTNTVPAE